jgi:ribosomal protein L7/L12
MDGLAIGMILGVILLAAGALVLRKKGELGPGFGPSSAPGEQRELDEQEREQLSALIAQKRLIEAIKFVRTRTGKDLKAAKDYVDGFRG